MVEKVCVLGAGSTKYVILNESIIEISINDNKYEIDFVGINKMVINAVKMSND